MKLQRPYIPIEVRVIVAERQIQQITGLRLEWPEPRSHRDRLVKCLAYLTAHLGGPLQLDHDPALCNRKYFPRTDRYDPAANDPRYLIYRTKEDHDHKTRLRGDGAQLSDLALRRKFKRIEKRKREGKR